MVHEGAFLVAHLEVHDAFVWRCVHFGGSYPSCAPFVVHATVFHLQVLVAGRDGDEAGHGRVCHLASISLLLYNLGKDLLGCITCNERVAKVLVDVHLARLLHFILAILALPFPFGQRIAQHAKNDTGGDGERPHSFETPSIVVLLYVRTLIIVDYNWFG